MAIEIIEHYLELYKQEKNDLVLKDDETTIREIVANYEKQVRETFAEKKAEEIATKESEIVALTILLARIKHDEEVKRELEKETELAENDNLETNNADETENVLGDVDLADL